MSADATGPTSHAAPLRVISRDGINWVAVADLVALLRGVADAAPDSPASPSLRMIADTFAQGESGDPLPDRSPEPPARPCGSCGVRVRSYPQISATQPEVVLNAAPTPYGQWMTLSTRDGAKALPFDRSVEARSGSVARFREHVCSGPYGLPGRRPAVPSPPP